MRLWILTSELVGEQAGGIARYADTFARAAAAAGHEITLIARTDTPGHTPPPGAQLVEMLPGYTRMQDPPTATPDKHPSYPYNVIGDWPGVSYQIAETVLERLRHEPAPDLIESQEFGALPYYLIQRKLTERGPLEQIPILVHLHTALHETLRVNQEPRFQFPKYWVGQMEKFCVRAADALLSPSQFLADHTRATLGADLSITTIPYPMLLPHEAGVAQAPTPGDLVYVGRLEVRKGILPLLSACERLWLAGETFRLTLIGGDTMFRPRNQHMSEHLRRRYGRWIDAGLLQMPGQMPQGALLQRMRGAWATLVPSLWENFPNTCVEAMGIGQVVVASRHGGQAEMIDQPGANGFLFDWEQPGSFESTLRDALALTPAERAAIGARAERRIRSLCDPAQVLAQRVAHMEQVVAEHSPRRLFPSMLESQPLAMTPSPPGAEVDGLLSVVIPFYNLGAYIAETIESVLAATYRPIEVVVVDDGSTDQASVAALDQVAAQHPEVRVERIANAGLATARNVGADAARGQYVAFLDADDTVEPSYYVLALDVLRRYENVAFVYSWVRWFEGANGIWPTWNAEFPYLLGHNMLAAFPVMARAHYLQAGRNKPVMAYNLEDYEAWISLIEAGGVGVSLPRPLVNYRIRANSMWRTSQLDQQLYLFERISELHPQAYQRWGAELFNLQNANGPALLWNHPALATAPQDAELAQMAMIRAEFSRGVWLSDMLRGGRLIARLRTSMIGRVLRAARRAVRR